MKILVANLGSTSLKYRLFESDSSGERLLKRGGFERVVDYGAAIGQCLDELKAAGCLASENELAAVGFKTVLAKDVTGCVLLDEPVLQAMEAFNSIAPAHNPPYITGIRLFAQRLPQVPLIGLFETAFYQWAPTAAMRYAVPQEWHDAGVRRLGFHGASHKFVAERSAELLGRPDIAERARRLYVDGPSATRGLPLRVISCHLGGSSSVTGILNGVAIGNSMGMSPQSGLPQNNRIGDLDAFAFPFLMRSRGLSLDEIERQLCRESGLKGVSGASNDLRDIQELARQGNARAQAAIDLLVHQTRHWIGGYHLELNGLDALVFTAGIGENRSEIRAAICARLDQLGISLDEGLNASGNGSEQLISTPESKVKIFVIPTNEELVVAREVRRYLDHAQTGSTSASAGHAASAASQPQIQTHNQGAGDMARPITRK